MTDHTWVLMPSCYTSAHNFKGAFTHACWTCGLFKDIGRVGFYDKCEKVLALARWDYGPGSSLDPFASMRTNTASSGCITGNPWGASSGGNSAPQGNSTSVTIGGGGGSGSLGTTASGMPVRKPVDYSYDPAEADAPKAAKPKEDIPGITEGGIDKDAYDDFMRGL